MTKQEVVRFCRDELDKHSLSDWHIRLTTNMNILGFCSYKDKCIILNQFHIETHPEPEIKNTILHEIAHALTPNHGHDDTWHDKARELGCTNTAPCSHLSFNADVIDAIRSGATVEVTYETEVIHKPKYQITRLQDKCEVCGKVARVSRETTVESKDETKPDRKFMFLECGHLLIKLIPKGTPFDTLESSDGKKPYPFQVDGMRFLEAALSVNRGGAIFDEMGLGKTIQALGYLKFHPEACPVLFIVKSAIKFQWFKEILRWCGNDWLPQIISKSDDWLIPNLKCYIISYDMLVFKERKGKNGKSIKQGFDGARFATLGIKTVILDECQQIKNPDASRTQEVRKIVKTCQVIPLSGTPWKNRGSEFYTVLNMLAPMKFPSHDGFLNTWVEFYFDGKYQRQGGIRNVARFREYIRDIAIRREINDVMRELPEVNRTLYYTELEAFEQQLYDEKASEFVQWYNERVISGEEDDFSTSGNILAKLAKMRHLIGLDKIPATVEFVTNFVEETGRKICIFVHHKDVGEILVNKLTETNPKIPVMKLTADQDSMMRFQMQEKFNNTPLCILVASTLASGEGINLQSCGDAVLHERQWNPQNEDQAAPGRFRRIGSEYKVVNVTCITAASTVDDILAGIVERKRRDFHNGMNKGEMPVWNERSFAKELAEGIVKDFNRRKGTPAKVLEFKVK